MDETPRNTAPDQPDTPTTTDTPAPDDVVDASNTDAAPGSDATTTSATPSERSLLERSPKLVVALVAVFAFVVVAALWLVLFSDRDSPDLAGVRMQLQLAYPIDADATAQMIGSAEAAPANAEITCRLTDDLRVVGTTTADANGAFTVELDADAWPQDDLTGDSFGTLNSTIECHAAGGAWVSPLQPPRVSIA